MSIQIGNYPENIENAVRAFWSGRKHATAKQVKSGKIDQGQRSAVTGGKHMDAFADVLELLVRKNGLENAEVHRGKKLVTLPGHFRPTKQWDVIVIHQEKLVAVLELKSLCGPSFGNNANNRSEEALGSALDFQTAVREGAFGDGATPFLGYLLLIEDHEKSRKPISASSPHFTIDSRFDCASYQQRMHLLCERMMQERLYSSAAVITAPNTATQIDCFSNIAESTCIKRFLTNFAAQIAAQSSM